MEETSVFPTPPLPLTTAMVFFILLSSFVFSNVGAPPFFDEQFCEQDEQSCVQPSAIVNYLLFDFY